MTLDKKLTVDVSYDLKIEDIIYVSNHVSIDDAMLVIEAYANSFINSPNIEEIKREELIARFKTCMKKLQNGR